MVIQEIARNGARARVDAPSPEALDLSIARLQGYFRRIQYPDGYWWGELESNNTMEAEYVMLSRFLGHHQPERTGTSSIISAASSWTTDRGRSTTALPETSPPPWNATSR